MDSEFSYLPAGSLANLQRRAELLRRLRAFFDARGFWEVQTPLLSRDTVIDRHLDPLCVTMFSDPRRPAVGPAWYLQTSPEFHMKRLLAAGAVAIYQVTQAFRGAEVGPRHNPEFTIVEWYRVGDDQEKGIELLADLAEELLDRPRATQENYATLFQRHCGVDPLSSSNEDLSSCAQAMLGHVPDRSDRDDVLNLLWSHQVEPQLGHEQPIVVYHYPASQAALAKLAPHDDRVAERFELYDRGVELANGYHELLDASELGRRQETVQAERKSDGKPPLPTENQLLAAMRHGLPPCAGVALGFDRLVMLACQAATLGDVMAFPYDRA